MVVSAYANDIYEKHASGQAAKIEQEYYTGMDALGMELDNTQPYKKHPNVPHPDKYGGDRVLPTYGDLIPEFDKRELELRENLLSSVGNSKARQKLLLDMDRRRDQMRAGVSRLALQRKETHIKSEFDIALADARRNGRWDDMRRLVDQGFHDAIPGYATPIAREAAHERINLAAFSHATQNRIDTMESHADAKILRSEIQSNTLLKAEEKRAMTRQILDKQKDIELGIVRQYMEYRGREVTFVQAYGEMEDSLNAEAGKPPAYYGVETEQEKNTILAAKRSALENYRRENKAVRNERELQESADNFLRLPPGSQVTGSTRNRTQKSMAEAGDISFARSMADIEPYTAEWTERVLAHSLHGFLPPTAKAQVEAAIQYGTPNTVGQTALLAERMRRTHPEAYDDTFKGHEVEMARYARTLLSGGDLAAEIDRHKRAELTSPTVRKARKDHYQKVYMADGAHWEELDRVANEPENRDQVLAEGGMFGTSTRSDSVFLEDVRTRWLELTSKWAESTDDTRMISEFAYRELQREFSHTGVTEYPMLVRNGPEALLTGGRPEAWIQEDWQQTLESYELDSDDYVPLHVGQVHTGEERWENEWMVVDKHGIPAAVMVEGNAIPQNVYFKASPNTTPSKAAELIEAEKARLDEARQGMLDMEGVLGPGAMINGVDPVAIAMNEANGLVDLLSDQITEGAYELLNPDKARAIRDIMAPSQDNAYFAGIPELQAIKGITGFTADLLTEALGSVPELVEDTLDGLSVELAGRFQDLFSSGALPSSLKEADQRLHQVNRAIANELVELPGEVAESMTSISRSLAVDTGKAVATGTLPFANAAGDTGRAMLASAEWIGNFVAQGLNDVDEWGNQMDRDLQQFNQTIPDKLAATIQGIRNAGGDAVDMFEDVTEAVTESIERDIAEAVDEVTEDAQEFKAVLDTMDQWLLGFNRKILRSILGNPDGMKMFLRSNYVESKIRERNKHLASLVESGEITQEQYQKWTQDARMVYNDEARKLIE